MEPIIPVYILRFWRVTECAIMVKAPAKIPPAPRPVTALPTINVVLFGATPHIKDPSSKRATTMMNSRFKLKFWNSFPYVGWDDIEVRRYAEPYQPASVNELKSFVILGLDVSANCRVWIHRS